MKSKILSSLIKPLKLDYVNPNITDDNFPDDGVRGTDPKIYHFNKYISSDDAIKEMDKEGYRPMTIHELLEWAKKGWNGEDLFVALGSAVELDGRLDVAYLSRNGRGRGLILGWFDDGGWVERCRFAAVRKSSEPGKIGSRTVTLDGSVATIGGKKYKLTLVK